MKKSFINTILMASACLLLLAFAAVPSAFAQASTKKAVAKAPAAQPATRTYVRMVVVRAKPGMMTEYLAFLKDEAKPLSVKSGTTNRSFWTVLTGGGTQDVTSFETLTGGLADLDPQTPTGAQKREKILGVEGSRAFIAKRDSLSTLFSTSVLQVMTNLSIMPSSEGEPKLVFAATNHIAPGRTAEYEAYIRNDVLPLVKKAGAKVYIVARTALGGDTNAYTTYLAMDSYADYDKFQGALRREGIDKVSTKVAGIVLRRDSQVLRYRADQSIRPAPMKASK